MKQYLGIDVGGTNIKYALLSEDAEILEHGEQPTPLDSLQTYLDTLVQIYQRYPHVSALAMSAPGRIDSMSGYFYSGGSLMYVHDMNLADLLADRIPIPFCAENDGKCAALAELWKGSMVHVRNGMIMALGTGIGGGIIIDGKLYRGSHFAAGEFSVVPEHMTETYTTKGMWGWSCSVRTLLNHYANLRKIDPAGLDGRIFFQNLENGDPEAAQALDWYSGIITNGIIALQGIMDVDRVAIGGGISRQPALLRSINSHLTECLDRMPSFFPVSRPEVVSCQFGNDANIIGALYHYLYEYLPAETAAAGQ